MAVHRLTLDEFDQVNYELIAIHTALEDYQLAYMINQKLPVLLSKNELEIQVSSREGESYFSRFTFESDAGEIWDLLQNKSEVHTQSVAFSSNLFGSETSVISARGFLLPEFKKVDFFLRIENLEADINEVMGKIKAIGKVSALQLVDAKKIKSKNNLIF